MTFHLARHHHASPLVAVAGKAGSVQEGEYAEKEDANPLISIAREKYWAEYRF
jgi:hypothetical protein